MDQVKVSISLPSSIHRAAKLEAIARDQALTVLLAEIITAKLRRRKLTPPAHDALVADGESLIRPTIFLESETYNLANERAEAKEQRLPTFLSGLIQDYFMRSEVAA